jgi:hypothetical protein
MGQENEESLNRHPVEQIFNGGTMANVLFVTNLLFYYKVHTPNWE